MKWHQQGSPIAKTDYFTSDMSLAPRNDLAAIPDR
jgi:hypothetical protein